LDALRDVKVAPGQSELEAVLVDADNAAVAHDDFIMAGQRALGRGQRLRHRRGASSCSTSTGGTLQMGASEPVSQAPSQLAPWRRSGDLAERAFEPQQVQLGIWRERHAGHAAQRKMGTGGIRVVEAAQRLPLGDLLQGELLGQRSFANDVGEDLFLCKRGEHATSWSVRAGRRRICMRSLLLRCAAPLAAGFVTAWGAECACARRALARAHARARRALALAPRATQSSRARLSLARAV